MGSGYRGYYNTIGAINRLKPQKLLIELKRVDINITKIKL